MGINPLLRKCRNSLIRLMGKNNIIIFESFPDFCDNTRAVFDEMLRQGLDRKYKLVWFTHRGQTLPLSNPRVRYVCPSKRGLRNKLRALWYRVKAKCIICCNLFVRTDNPKTICFYLAHGTPMKSVRHYYNVPSCYQYCLAASAHVQKMTAYEFRVEEHKMFCLGYPRNDVLTQTPRDVTGILETTCQKVIVWYPTFRQHKGGRKTGSTHPLPIIHDAQAARALNDYAAQHNILIVMKPHFSQITRNITDQKLSNLRFIDDSFFSKHQLSSYEFVAGCDALITDYSSIYYDYTLCDKPIALIWEDLEEYRQEPGFAVDLDFYGKGAQIVYTLEELQRFLAHVGADQDPYQAQRRQIRDLVNYSTDGKNAQRVVAFIREKTGM